MKSNKLMKFLLSLFIALSITCTCTEITSAATSNNYNSEIRFWGEDFDESPFGGIEKQ